MLSMLVAHPELLGARRFVYPSGEIAIRPGEGEDLTVSSGWHADRICRVELLDGAAVLSNFTSRGKVYVGGRQIYDVVRVGPTMNVRIGAFVFHFRNAAENTTAGVHPPYVARDPVEHSLLREIVGTDPSSRVVYADWLEEQGEPLRAEYVRVQDELVALEPGSAAHNGHTARLAALALQVAVSWRIRVSRPAIERCEDAFRFRCPKEWSRLEPTARDQVRHCGTCRRDVHYALDVCEARELARQGHCVALDVTSGRWADDLAGLHDKRVCRSCQLDRGSAYPGRSCPHCGDEPPRRVLVGQIR